MGRLPLVDRRQLAAGDAGLLGSIDATRGNTQNRWDTDLFPLDLYDTLGAMLVVLRPGGRQPGGLSASERQQRSGRQEAFRNLRKQYLAR